MLLCKTKLMIKQLSRLLFLSILAIVWISSPSLAQKRVALVIGNSDYSRTADIGNLTNPKNDASDIAAALKRNGFELIGGGVQLDLDRQAMFDRILEFGDQLGPGVVSLFYYAGHGVAVDNINYLVPVDGGAKNKRQVRVKMVAADLVLEQFTETGGGLNIMILDSCRNTPAAYRGIRAVGNQGMAEMKPTSGTLISYATQPGNVAADGRGRNSPYAKALIDVMSEPDVDILRSFNQVSLKVKKATSGFQVPWTTSVALEGDFYFVPKGSNVAVTPPSVKPPTFSTSKADRETLFWESIKDSKNPKMLAEYLKIYPTGTFSGLAAVMIEDLQPTKQSPGQPQKLATLTPATSILPIVTNRKELIRSVQTELNRIGCTLGRADGSWGRKSQAAVKAFNKHSKLRMASLDPNRDLLLKLQKRKDRVCPKRERKKIAKSRKSKKLPWRYCTDKCRYFKTIDECLAFRPAPDPNAPPNFYGPACISKR